MNIKNVVGAGIALALLAGVIATAADAQGMAAKPPLNEPIDYSMLHNLTYDYDDIAKAKQAGLKDDDVARIVKISRQSGRPFRYYVGALARGESWLSLTTGTNVPFYSLKDIGKEKDELAAYEAAWFATGDVAARRDNIDYLLAKAAMVKPDKKK